MEGLLDSIKEFLFQTKMSALDTMIVSFAVAVLVGVFGKFSSFFLNIFKLIITSIFNFYKKLISKYIRQHLSINEYIEVKERLEKGGNLKWYEKKGFEESQKAEKELAKTFKGLGEQADRSISELNRKMNENRRIK